MAKVRMRFSLAIQTFKLTLNLAQITAFVHTCAIYARSQDVSTHTANINTDCMWLLAPRHGLACMR